MLLIYMSFIDDESHRRLFEEIYLSYRKQMFLVARTVLKNDSDAEDIVHDVFLRIAKKYMAKISTIENETDLRNYLLKATKTLNDDQPFLGEALLRKVLKGSYFEHILPPNADHQEDHEKESFFVEQFGKFKEWVSHIKD